MTKRLPVVGIADIGHPEHSDGTSHFGAWVTTGRTGCPFTTPRQFALAAGLTLKVGNRLVLGFECPSCATVGDRSVERPEERGYDRSWWRGSGATVTILGSSQVPFVLERIVETVRRPLVATVDAQQFALGMGDVLLIEAFAAGSAKGGPRPDAWEHSDHVWDAYGAAQAALEQLRQGKVLVTTTQTGALQGVVPVMNLVVAAALYAGFEIDPGEIRKPCVTIRPVRAEPQESSARSKGAIA